MSILSALGFIFLCLICKFIWDTATNKEQTSASGVKTLTQKPVVEVMDRKDAMSASLNIMAKALNCMPTQAKTQYQVQLIQEMNKAEMDDNSLIAFLENGIRTMHTASFKQAPMLFMHPDDTPPALTAEWAGELLPFFKDTFYKSEEALHVTTPGTNMPKFGLVQILEIKPPAGKSSDATLEKIVVYSQSFAYTYSLNLVGESRIDVGIRSRTITRTFSEFWTLDELAQANDGNGLAPGDQLPGICISSISSIEPFYECQLPFYRTGFYYKSVLEFSADSQPKDRTHQIHKRTDPETAARIENTVKRGEYFNFNYAPKSNADDRAMSLAVLADKYGCEVEQVKEQYCRGLVEMITGSGVSNTQIIQLLSETLDHLRQSKGTEAIQLGMDPDDTPAAFAELWLRELLEIIEAKQESLVLKNQKPIEVASIPYTRTSDDISDLLSTTEYSYITTGKVTLAYFQELYIKRDDETLDGTECYVRTFFSTEQRQNVDLRLSSLCPATTVAAGSKEGSGLI